MGRGRRPNFVVFIFKHVLIIDGWVVLAWGRRSYLEPAENASFVFLALFRHIVLARSRSVRRASHQSAFMGSCLAINHTCLPCSEKMSLCNQRRGMGVGRVVISSSPDLQVGLCSFSVCGRFMDDQANGGWFFSIGCRCYSRQSHHLAWFAINRRASRTSLPDGSRLVKFLGEWLWDWGILWEWCYQRKAYIKLNFKMAEWRIGKAPESHC